jgi:asparagine synthase (glutamine-hydrolysing)
MEPILPKRITWRVDKLGFDSPQEAWLREPEVRDLINECRAKLVAERVIHPSARSDDWQCLMAERLFEFVAA